MATLKVIRPNLRVIVIGAGMEDEAVLKAIAFGAKGLRGRSCISG